MKNYAHRNMICFKKIIHMDYFSFDENRNNAHFTIHLSQIWYTGPFSFLSLIPRGEICRWQCKIFASGVDLSIFTNFFVFYHQKVEIRWNWGSKIFGLKIRRSKFFYKSHVWSFPRTKLDDVNWKDVWKAPNHQNYLTSLWLCNCNPLLWHNEICAYTNYYTI